MRLYVKKYFNKMKQLWVIVFFAFLTSCGIQINEGFVDAISDSTPTNATSTLSVDQTDDDNTDSGFGGGSHTGTTYSASVLTLNSTTNNTDLDESWTPKYSNIDTYFKFEGSGTIGDGSTVVAAIGVDAIVENGNASGFSYTAGKINDGIIFDGVDDSLELISGTPIFGTPMSFFAWITCSAPPAGGATVYAEGLSSSNNHKLLFYINSGTGNLSFSNRADDFSYPVTNSAIVRICDDNNWKHIGFTDDGAGNLKVYYNSKIVYSSSYTPSTATRNTVAIGMNPALTHGSFFTEKMDEVARWSSVLTDDEVALIYSRQLAKFSGEMKSRIIDSENTNSQWTNLGWIAILPFGKELPGSSGSESSSDYSSLVGSTGSTSDDDLMSGLIGLWHLNETTWDGTANEVIDSSGNNLHGTAVNALTSSGGIFGRKGTFDGDTDHVSLNYTTLQNILQADMTISAWVSLSDPIENSPSIMGNMELLGGWSGWWLRIDETTLQPEFYYGNDINVITGNVTSATAVNLNQFHHIVVTWDFTNRRLLMYLDGVQTGDSGTGLGTFGPNNVDAVYIGRSGQHNYDFVGAIDEVATWSRTLTSSEILQLYRRGANRIKYQVRTCTSSDCSDQDALTGDGWKGPGGNYLTYFSELYNNSSVTATCTTAQECYSSELSLQGDVSATKPSIYFNSFGTDGLLGIDNNRYFQYRVIMESDDENTACDSGTATCMPELKSVTIGPEHSYEE